MQDRRTFIGGGAALLAEAALGGTPGRPADAAGGPDALAGLTLGSAAALLKAAKVSPVDLTRACLARIEALDGTLNTFITLTAGQALADAQRCEVEIRRGGPRSPLHGIPVALKDNIDTAGVRTTAASRLFITRVPAEDAEVVRRLKAAGAILLGKLNMDEWAYGVSSTSGNFGPVRNPWNTAHVAGGSSGGPAAAVAARLCFGAIGTDTGGSIRQPAAWCNVVGLKPTYARVSTQGVMPLSWSMDHVGPLARTVADTRLLFEVIASPTSGCGDAVPGPALEALRLGRPDGYYRELDPEVAAVAGKALAVLGRLVRSIEGIVLPDIPSLPLMFVESAAHYGPLVAGAQDTLAPPLRMLLAMGDRIPATRYASALRELDDLRNRALSCFGDVDLIVTPTTPDLPPTIEAARNPAAGRGPPRSARNTTPFNIYGWPTVSVPCGFTRTGLPVGLQVSGPPGGEAVVLALAAAYERETGWHERGP